MSFLKKISDDSTLQAKLRTTCLKGNGAVFHRCAQQSSWEKNLISKITMGAGTGTKKIFFPVIKKKKSCFKTRICLKSIMHESSSFVMTWGVVDVLLLFDVLIP